MGKQNNVTSEVVYYEQSKIQLIFKELQSEIPLALADEMNDGE